MVTLRNWSFLVSSSTFCFFYVSVSSSCYSIPSTVSVCLCPWFMCVCSGFACVWVCVCLCVCLCIIHTHTRASSFCDQHSVSQLLLQSHQLSASCKGFSPKESISRGVLLQLQEHPHPLKTHLLTLHCTPTSRVCGCR